MLDDEHAEADDVSQPAIGAGPIPVILRETANAPTASEPLISALELNLADVEPLCEPELCQPVLTIM